MPWHCQGLRWFRSEHDNCDVLFQQIFLDVTYPHASSLLDYLAVQTRGLEEVQLLPNCDLAHMG